MATSKTARSKGDKSRFKYRGALDMTRDKLHQMSDAFLGLSHIIFVSAKLKVSWFKRLLQIAKQKRILLVVQHCQFV